MPTDLSYSSFSETLSAVRFVQQKIEMVVLTNKGEVRFDPDYGANIRRYLFEPSTRAVSDQIIEDVKTAIEDRVPEFFLEKIDVKRESSDGILRLNIKGKILSTGDDITTNIEVS